jgi:hypothetical protein
VYVLETSSDQAIAVIINNRQEAIRALTPIIEKLGKCQDIRYWFFRYCFVAGVLLIAIARAYPALASAQPFAL